MSELKTRYYVTPSSIGSYFGVGFNDPLTQFKIDSAQEVSEFDDAAQERMDWGKFLEDGALDFFAHKLGIEITDRNNEFKMGYDDKIKYIVDGIAMFNGERIVVENKISNAASYKFTDSMGYIMQCQLYMYLENVNKALLCGIYQGKPIFKFIDRDDDMIKDLLEMTDFVVNCLMGMDDFDNFPTHLLEKYGTADTVKPIEGLSETTINYFRTLAELEAEAKAVENKIKEFKKTYEDLVAED